MRCFYRLFIVLAIGHLGCLAYPDSLQTYYTSAVLKTQACAADGEYSYCDPVENNESMIGNRTQFGFGSAAAVAPGGGDVIANGSVSSTFGDIGVGAAIDRTENSSGPYSGSISLQASIQGGGDFFDYVTITGAEKASVLVGMPVYYTFTKQPNDAPYSAEIDVRFQIDGQDVQNAKTYEVSEGKHTLLGTVEFVLDTTSDNLPPSATLSPYIAHDWADFDASGSAHFYLDSQTPGVVITSASGHDYSSALTAVPEPGTAVLLLLAGSLILVWPFFSGHSGAYLAPSVLLPGNRVSDSNWAETRIPKKAGTINYPKYETQ